MVKNLEGDMFVVFRLTNNFTFQVENYDALLSHFIQNEWVVNFGSTHHMAKDASLFMRLNKSKESKIYVVDDLSLDIVGQGDVSCQHGKIV
jgi:hypothetical protein